MHISPEIADTFGLKILAIGVVVAVVGIVLARSTASKK
jgi:hypothetical protein